MSSKLLILTIGLLIYFFAATDAATTLSTYSDSACSNRTGMFQVSFAHIHRGSTFFFTVSLQNTDACGIEVQTRSINGVSCFGEAPGPYYNYAECNTQAVPTTAIPEGWQYLKYATNNNCEFSLFQIIACKFPTLCEVGSIVNLNFLSRSKHCWCRKCQSCCNYRPWNRLRDSQCYYDL